MQCGCQCIRCTYGEFDSTQGYQTFTSTDVDVCNNVPGSNGSLNGRYVECVERDESNCSPVYSSLERLPFCAVQEPSLWAPLYFLTNLFSRIGNEQRDFVSSPASETQFLYTSESAFGAAAMGRVVRLPDVALLTTDAGISEEVEVRLLRFYVVAVLP